MNAWTGTLDIGNNGLVIAVRQRHRSVCHDRQHDRVGLQRRHLGRHGHHQQPRRGVDPHQHAAEHRPGGFHARQRQLQQHRRSIVFEGQTITTNAVLVRLTYMDDLVLAGDMAQNDATNDALLFAANYGIGTTWSVGDLTHDGAIDSNDALLFAANYVVGLPSLDGTTGGERRWAARRPCPSRLRWDCWPSARPACWRCEEPANAKSRLEAECSTTAELFVPDFDGAPCSPLAALSLVSPL